MSRRAGAPGGAAASVDPASGANVTAGSVTPGGGSADSARHGSTHGDTPTTPGRDRADTGSKAKKARRGRGKARAGAQRAKRAVMRALGPPPPAYTSVVEGGGSGGADGSLGAGHASLDKAVAGGKPAATVSSTMINLTNNILGAGVLALPWAVRMATFFPGMVLLCIVCLANTYSFILIARCCALGQCSTFKEIGERAFGRVPGLVIQTLTMLYSMGTCIGHVDVIGDFIPHTFQYLKPDSYFTNRTLVILVFALGILFPLSSQKDLNALRYTSLLAVIFIVYGLGLLVVRELQFGHINPTVHFVHGSWSDFFVALPLFSVSFTAHYNAPKFVTELRAPRAGGSGDEGASEAVAAATRGEYAVVGDVPPPAYSDLELDGGGADGVELTAHVGDRESDAEGHGIGGGGGGRNHSNDWLDDAMGDLSGSDGEAAGGARGGTVVRRAGSGHGAGGDGVALSNLASGSIEGDSDVAGANNSDDLVDDSGGGAGTIGVNVRPVVSDADEDAAAVTKFTRVASSSTAVCLVVFISAGAAGVFRFGDGVDGNILDNLSNSNAAAITARLGLAAAVSCAYPLVCNCARNALDAVCCARAGGITATRRILETLIVVMCTVVVALLVPAIEMVFAFKGALIGSLIVYILPALMYLRLRRKYGAEGSRRLPDSVSEGKWDTINPLLLAGFGVVAMFVGTYGAYMHALAVQGEGEGGGDLASATGELQD